MMWFDPQDPRALFVDLRNETHELCDNRTIHITPDIQADFTNLPFADESFQLVVFDPLHLERLGRTSWTYAKYGALFTTWREDLACGFEECFRILKPGGVLVFKWNEYQIPINEIIALSPHKPLFGHRSGKRALTHWVTFMKEPRHE